ncbi:MAG: type II toxin-antitoxin system HicA family toxin [Caldilineaceae bacterium SB0670_bin_27]|uniref:Type II toxin-antitoxin system HicA family toxin n=1 Tax=Caldilineaceae bacterium SB0664_bin_27 TaxID=2605260 RepID=A0A6B0YYB1_9CHLR|nr:type II toxin-antitoxin system HicA family toxin [Caldilineaceae bacterium SB0664_bin_27]MYJ77737.1 type II toxin-antitoxin system HicA family toxin [Caldilineaceae bacterium SB0670_bin_27]
MPRLRPRPTREIIRILSENGFDTVRQTGSHIIMQTRSDVSSGQLTTITVIVPDKREIPVGTMSSIIRHSKLPRKLFE